MAARPAASRRAPARTPSARSLWLKHERPEVYAAAATFLDVPDYLTMRLTRPGRRRLDTVVGCAGARDNRDLAAVRYDDELVERCGIDAAKLPELVPTGSVVGTALPEVAAELGARPARAGRHRHRRHRVGRRSAPGAVRDYEAHLYIGTSAWLSATCPFKKTDIRTNITSLPSVIPGRYWVATEQDVAGKALDWLIDNVVLPRRRARRPAGPRRRPRAAQRARRHGPARQQRRDLHPVAQRRAHPGRRPPTSAAAGSTSR